MKTDGQQAGNKCERGGNALWTEVSASGTGMRTCTSCTRVGVRGFLAYVLNITHPLEESMFQDSGRTIIGTLPANFFQRDATLKTRSSS
jgi:hypothetical protein